MRQYNPSVLAALLALSLASSSFGQEGERELQSEALGQPAKTWFDPKVCSKSADRRIHALIGNAVLALPVDNVRALMPSSISRISVKAGNIIVRIGQTAGCRETPFPTAAVTLSGLKNVRSGRIVLSATPDNREAFEAQLAKIRDSGMCSAASPGLVYCEGNRTTASGRQEIAYVIATNASMRQASGGPLRALCVLDSPPRCSVLDDAEGGVRFESVVSGAPTLEKIQQVDAEGRSALESLRVR